MMNGGEAADQMVSYSLKYGEVVLRLTGDGAKHLAAYLLNVLNNPKPGRGAVKLKRLLAEGRELSVQRIAIDEIKAFRVEAKKYGVEFCVLKNTNLGDGRCDILFKTEDAQRVNRIFDNLEMTRQPDTARVTSEIIKSKEEKERDTENPPGARKPARMQRASGNSSPIFGEAHGGKPSIRETLSAIRADRKVAPIIPPRGRVNGKKAR